MVKHKIIAARKLQVIGHDGDVEAGTELATIETECELSSLVSLLHFGSAIVEPVEAPEDDTPQTTTSKPSRRKAAAAPASAPAGDGGTKGNIPTRRRR